MAAYMQLLRFLSHRRAICRLRLAKSNCAEGLGNQGEMVFRARLVDRFWVFLAFLSLERLSAVRRGLWRTAGEIVG